MRFMHLRLLGRLELVGENGPVSVPGAVARAIVGRLLLAGGAVVRRDDLVDELWEDRTAKDPVNALQVQVTKLRAAFAAKGEEGRLLFRHGGYRFVLRPDDEVDVHLFEAAVRRGREQLAAGAYEQAEHSVRQGLSLWRGRALEDLVGRVFDGERARLEALRLGALEDAATAGLELGRAEELIPELQALVSLSPLRERARARLMLALYRGGRPAEALEVYEAGRRLLGSHLGVGPAPELRSLHAAILRHDPALEGAAPVRLSQAPAGSRPAPAGAGQDQTEGNLVRPLGPFVGRRQDIGALGKVVGRERLVTVLGPGGVGKTRLTLEMCAQVRPSYQAVWWVDLASVDESGVRAEILSTLGLSDAFVRPEQPRQDYVHRLGSFLAGRQTLLALDNCEHVLDAVGPLVATLLSVCPSLTVVATSRAPLAIAVEALYPLAPMADEEAAELFRACAAMADPSFAPDATVAGDIRSLCRRLDGLPLAVELAAAHVRMLSVAEIEARLDDRFALLAKGGRNAPARHRTLRAVLDWSYALLDTAEQRLLTELSLYAGGCPLDVAEAATPCTARDGAEILVLLAQLVDKSLLVPVSTPQGSRLRMLETVREYALARLKEEEGAAARAEQRFMAWAAGFAQEGSQGIASGDQRVWARRITEESPNLRAASDLMTARGRTAESLQLEARLGYYWFISGREPEGIDRLRRALAAYDAAAGEGAAAPTGEEEWALFHTLAWLTWLHRAAGGRAEAGSYSARHQAVWRRTDHPDLAVLGLCYETLHAMLNGRDNLEELFAQADAAVNGTRLHWDRAVLQTNWSTYCLQHQDTEGARRHGLAAVEASRAAHDDFARVFSLILCGDADESDGLRPRARQQWTEAASILRHIGARTRWAYAVLRLACLDIAEGACDTAERRLTDVDRLADELSADDLHAAVANLRGVLALREDRFTDAESVFRAVWDSAATPLDRKAVACTGMTVLRTFGPSNRSRFDDAQSWLGRARQAHGRLQEPLKRRAVGVMVDRLEAHHTGRSGPGEAHSLDAWLAGRPSVLAAFS